MPESWNRENCSLTNYFLIDYEKKEFSSDLRLAEGIVENFNSTNVGFFVIY